MKRAKYKSRADYEEIYLKILHKEREDINFVNKVCNIILNIIIFLSGILGVFTMLINGNIFPTIFSFILNRLKLDLRIFDIQITVDFRGRRIRVKKGNYYE